MSWNRIILSIKKLLNRISNSEFIKSIMTLSLGVVISQIIVLIASPIISRLYSPTELGDFSILISSAAILNSFITLGLMTAIMIPKEDEDSHKLCTVLLAITFTLTVSIVVVAIIFSKKWQAFNIISIDYRISCVILGIFIILSNINSIIYAYANRQKKYKAMFINPILSSIINYSISIITGFLGFGLYGYIGGNLIALIVCNIYLLNKVNPFKVKYLKRITLVHILKEYRNFPLFQLPSNILSSFANQLSIQLISRFFGNALLGIYSMSMRILELPISYLSAPVNRVYFKEATSRINKGEEIGNFSFRILKTNIKLAIFPIFLLIVFGEQLFRLVFGNSWSMAGEFASILGLYQLVVFCTQCLSGNFVIIGKQKINFAFSIVLLFTNGASFIFGYLIFKNIYITLILYSILGSFVKLADIGLFLHLTGVKIKEYLSFVTIYILVPVIVAVLIKHLLIA